MRCGSVGRHLRWLFDDLGFGMRRLFDHVDLRVRSLAEVRGFYVKFLPAVRFSEIDENADWIGFSAKRDEPTAEFIG